MTELDALLILNAIGNVSNRSVHRIIEYFGSAQEIFKVKPKEIAGAGVFSSNALKSFVQFPKDDFLKKEHKLIAKKKVKVLTIDDEEFPSELKNISDAPIILYVAGELPQMFPLSIGIVGSRRASHYGLRVARKFGERLADMGATVISGMARGIDTSAHQGALAGNGKTVAVLGCGLEHVYPPENKKLMQEIINTGAVISEFSMEAPPISYNFPRRNRIVSGLSFGVIVVEAAQRSGALITADFALEQGREVYAVPGPVDSSSSKGVNDLIKQGARLIAGIDEVIADIHPHLVRSVQREKMLQENDEDDFPFREELSKDENRIYKCVSDQPIHVDQLVVQTNIGVSALAPILMKLELKQLIKQLPGKRFVR